MKIAIIFEDALGPGGAQRVINNLAIYYSEHLNYDVEVISYDKKKDKNYYTYNNKVKVTNLNVFKKNKNFLLKYINKIKGLKYLRKYLLENNYDIIMSIASETNIILGRALKGFENIIVATEHIYYEGHSLKSRLRKRIYYKRFSRVVVLTDYDYGKYSKYLTNIIKIHNSISNLFKYNGYNSDFRKMLAAGRFTEQKGFDMLIKSMIKVTEKYPDWKLDILGEGTDKESLEKLIKENALENNITIKPYSDRFHDIMEEYSFYIMSSRYEAFPCVLIEAQAKGLPIVSFDCKTGPNEIINNGEDGILVEANNTGKLSDAIIQMIELNGTRIDYSKNAVENSKRFNIDKICLEWDKLFKEVINENKNR